MQKHTTIMGLVAALFLALPGFAQPWNGILSNSRAADWSTAGLPAVFPDGETTPNPWTPPTRTQCGSTLTPTGGDDAALINAAVGACAAGHYVLLGSGTFQIGSNLLIMYGVNNITLRGSGPMQTSLRITGSNFVYMGGASGATGSGSFTANYPAGTTQIVVGSVSGSAPVANTLAFITQSNSPDNGGLFVTGDAGDDYNQQQAVFITAVTNLGSGQYRLTLNHGLYMSNWTTANGASITWRTPGTQGVGLGFEDVTVIGNGNSSGYGLVLLDYAYASWVRGVRFLGTTAGYGVTRVYNTAGILYANNYIVGALYNLSDNGSIISYHIDHSSDVLTLNNIAHLGEGAEYHGRNSGLVTAYNFNRDAWTTGTGNTWSFDHHGFSSFDLWEGNIGGANTEDNLFGSHALNTYFRNLAWCYDPPYAASAAANYSIIIDNRQRFENVIGNAMGGPSSACPTYQGTGAGIVYWINTGDPLAGSTLMRWGNVTTATQPSDTPAGSGIRFLGSEVPSTLSAPNVSLSNPVPSSNALPTSFFMNSMSAHPNGGTGLNWWKTCTSWTAFPTTCAAYTAPALPIAGPDVTGGIYLNGYAGDNPAGLAWKNLPVDSALQNSYSITSSTWVGGIETLIISGLPGSKFLMGAFQLSGVNAACTSGATFNAANEILITASSATTVSYALAANPGVQCTGTFKWPNVRQFDQRVYATDSSGGGSPAVTLGATSHDFGGQIVGVQSAGYGISVQNTGTAVLSIASITPSGDFGYSSNCPIAPSTLGIGISCTITATFTPTQPGARSGSIVVSDNAAGSPRTISLIGTGVPAQSGSIGTGISAGQVIIR